MAEPALLAATDLGRFYPRRGSLWQQRRGGVAAVHGVTLRVEAGEAIGVVGPSGAGKSTLARLLAGLEMPDAGRLEVGGTVIKPRRWRALARVRRTVQLVFQDPALSLNPRQRVGAAVREPLLVRGVRGEGARARVAELLEQVGLPTSAGFAASLPRDLSGGERQRVALARALACEPALLVLDEPTAALDASVRGQVINLLQTLRRQRGLALVLITHDVALAAALTEKLAVLVGGTIVEEGKTGLVLARPQHATTAALVAAWAAARVGEHLFPNPFAGKREGCSFCEEWRGRTSPLGGATEAGQ